MTSRAISKVRDLQALTPRIVFFLEEALVFSSFSRSPFFSPPANEPLPLSSHHCRRCRSTVSATREIMPDTARGPRAGAIVLLRTRCASKYVVETDLGPRSLRTASGHATSTASCSALSKKRTFLNPRTETNWFPRKTEE